MDISVEVAAGCELPANSHVSVRIGDVVKQGRYDPSRLYHFPGVDRRRHAKLDIFKYVGSAVVAISPESEMNSSQVQVTTSDASFGKIEMLVNARRNQHHSTVERAQQRSQCKESFRQQGLAYIKRTGIEVTLAEGVQELLKEHPIDPVDFLCKFLRNSSNKTSCDSMQSTATPMYKSMQSSSMSQLDKADFESINSFPFKDQPDASTRSSTARPQLAAEAASEEERQQVAIARRTAETAREQSAAESEEAAAEDERQRLVAARHTAEVEREQSTAEAAAEEERQQSVEARRTAELKREHLAAEAAAEDERQRLAAARHTAEVEREQSAAEAAAEEERQQLVAAEEDTQRLVAASCTAELLAAIRAAEAEREQLAVEAAADELHSVESADSGNVESEAPLAEISTTLAEMLDDD